MSNTFEIKIWDPNNDEIVSQFLDVLCLAYNTKNVFTKKSFLWTHRDNPAGHSKISYASDSKTDSVVAICPRTRHLSIDLPICPEHLRSKKMALSNIDVDVE